MRNFEHEDMPGEAGMHYFRDLRLQEERLKEYLLKQQEEDPLPRVSYLYQD